MAAANQSYGAGSASIRCPACGRAVQLPARDCPFCEVDLKEAALPKRKGMSWLRIISLSLSSLICLAVAVWLIKAALFGGPFIPEFIQARAPAFVTDITDKITGFFK